MNTASSPARFNMTRLRLDLAEVTVQRNALLAALRFALPYMVQTLGEGHHAVIDARAAIAKAEASPLRRV